jgi:2,4-dienoyl-CoA reductase [(3E)-enoyl-CoA-producing], peroxisomal
LLHFFHEYGIISSSSSPFRSDCLLGKVALIYIVYFFIMAASSSPSVSASPSSSPFRSDCLLGKVALITGGGSGIGFEIARQLLRHGCRGVVICGRREKFLRDACAALSMMTIQRDEQQQQKPPQVLYHVCDVRNFNDCEAAIDYTRRSFDNQLDVLVNGAAGNFLARAKELSAKGFATVIAIDTCE